ncbi:MAG: YdiU family protein [Saprospiraceae bacterium]|nr:YdiU family protein [Saprospiraceae bacterium]
MIKFNIKDTFNKELPADPDRENKRRQVYHACYSFVEPRRPSSPQIVHVSKEMARTLGMTPDQVERDEFLEIFSGSKPIPGTQPYAMCYGGHQFGHWAGQLGDGRAINLCEVLEKGQRWTLQLKGAGATPYARSADGLAVLRSSIREHLCSEAMFHLGIPTTRSLSLILTGDDVLRDIMYNGNAEYEKGAVVCRTAPSFIRFGNFQIFFARKDEKTLKALTDYTIRHFYPHLEEGTVEGYLNFFKEVAERTLNLVVDWQRVGFVHGVMNTDNMSILGLTIDYGPYGWLEGYDHDWTPNTTDRESRRYRYGHQPGIALWNLAQLASALFPLIQQKEKLQEILDQFETTFYAKYLSMMWQKLGLMKHEKSDVNLISELENTLQITETDMTIFYRLLSDLRKEMTADQAISVLNQAFYTPEEVKGTVYEKWRKWLTYYLARLKREEISDEERKIKMNLVNPKYVLRNYIAQLAIDQADQGDYSLVDELYQLLQKPYEEQPDKEKWFARRPEWARHKVGCSMLSCSS